MRISDRNDFSALSSAVMKAITRKILNSSLAATRLAEKDAPSALTGLPVMARITRKVPTIDGTTTFGPQDHRQDDDCDTQQIRPVCQADFYGLLHEAPLILILGPLVRADE